MGGTEKVEDEGDILQKRKMKKSKRSEKNGNGFIEKTSDSSGVTNRRVGDFNVEFSKVEKKKKSSKEKEKGSNDVDIQNLVEEEPVGDIDHVGGKNKEEGKKKKKKSSKEKEKGSNDVDIQNLVEEEPVGDIDHVGGKNKEGKKKKKKKRKMELEKNTGYCEDGIELKFAESIKKGSNDVDIQNLIEEELVGDIDHVGGKNKEEEKKKKKKKKRKMELEKNTGYCEDGIELKSTKSTTKGSNDVDIQNLVEEEPVGDIDHVGGKNKEEEEEEKKKKKKKRKMELEKNTGYCEDGTELKSTKSIKKLRGNKMENDGDCCHDIDYDVAKAKELPNEYYHVGEEKSVGGIVIRKNEEVPIGASQPGLIKNEIKGRKKDNKNKDKEDISSLLVNDREMLKDNATISCKSVGKGESSYSTESERGQQMEKKKQKNYDKMDKEDRGIKSFKTKSSDEVPVQGGTSTAIGRETLEDKDCVGEGSTERKSHVVVSHNKRLKKRDKEVPSVELEKNDDQNKRKKAKSVKDVLIEKADKGDPRRKRTSEGDDHSPNSKVLKPSKRVRFSGHVEVLPSPHATDLAKDDKKKELVQGKRFSKEEDEMIKTSVFDYIEERGLGEDGLNMILHCRSHPELIGCWKEIASALPWRTIQSVYYRGHILFERDEKHKWTEEEYELIRRVHEKHGSKWKMLADVLGKHRFHVKDTWRRVKLPNLKRGHWSQEEYQTLFDLVNMDLRMKAFEEKKSKHGMLRDNISWASISDKLATRIHKDCCEKWYGQLTSPMVAEGLWADVDDYRLLNVLYYLDACCVEDVDWDNLLDDRSGDLCRQRWNQMVNHIGKHGVKSFAEQVEVLSKRYCPELLEVREAIDSRPTVP